MIEINIITRLNDFRPFISRGGNIVFIVNQDNTNTCQMIDTRTLQSILTLDIPASQVMAFMSTDCNNIIVYYVVEQTMSCQVYDLSKTLLNTYDIKQIKAIYSICEEFISYVDTNDSNWIIELDDYNIPYRSFATIGSAFDILKINNHLVYVENKFDGDKNYVEIVANNGIRTYKYYVGSNVLAYMTKVKNYVVISLTPRTNPKKVRIVILKLKNGILNLRMDEEFESNFTSYVYMDESKRTMLASIQKEDSTIVNLIQLRRNNITGYYSSYSYLELVKVKGTDWIFNYSGNFTNIVGMSPTEQKIVII